MKLQPGVFSFQVNVPHSVYGECEWFIPAELKSWLTGRGLSANYCGGSSWGNGYTNGVSNRESNYMVRDATEQDGLAFKIMFPKCSIYICQQYADA